MLNIDRLQYRLVNTRLHSQPKTNTKLLCFSTLINCFNG